MHTRGPTSEVVFLVCLVLGRGTAGKGNTLGCGRYDMSLCMILGAVCLMSRSYIHSRRLEALHIFV